MNGSSADFYRAIERTTIAAADTCAILTARGRDIAGIDGEAALAGRYVKAPVVATTDASAILTTCGFDGATVDIDVSGIHILDTADAGIVIATFGYQLTRTAFFDIDVQRMAACHIDHRPAIQGVISAENDVHRTPTHNRVV